MIRFVVISLLFLCSTIFADVVPTNTFRSELTTKAIGVSLQRVDDTTVLALGDTWYEDNLWIVKSDTTGVVAWEQSYSLWDQYEYSGHLRDFRITSDDSSYTILFRSADSSSRKEHSLSILKSNGQRLSYETSVQAYTQDTSFRIFTDTNYYEINGKYNDTRDIYTYTINEYDNVALHLSTFQYRQRHAVPLWVAIDSVHTQDTTTVLFGVLKYDGRNGRSMYTETTTSISWDETIMEEFDSSLVFYDYWRDDEPKRSEICDTIQFGDGSVMGLWNMEKYFAYGGGKDVRVVYSILGMLNVSDTPTSIQSTQDVSCRDVPALYMSQEKRLRFGSHTTGMVTLTNLQGRKLYSGEVDGASVDLSSLAPGLILWQLQNGGAVQSGRFLIGQ